MTEMLTGAELNTIDTQILIALQSQTNDKDIAKAATEELAKRVRWSHVAQKKSHYVNENSYYICSYGGSGSKMLQAYLSNFGNTFHVHSRHPPKKLMRVGTKEYPEWFNDIEVVPILDRQIPRYQVEEIKVIFIYRDPIYAIRSRIIPGETYRISSDHLNNITSTHWNIESVVGNMMDLWELESFFDNYTTFDKDRNYKIYCVNYDKFWDNIEKFNEVLELPNVPELYPTRKESTKYKPVYERELRTIYANLLKKMDELPPVFVVDAGIHYEKAKFNVIFRDTKKENEDKANQENSS